MASMDAVTLEILWERLYAIADEAAAQLKRTSFSPIVRESNDFSCVLFDHEGNAIAENTIGIPSFNAVMSHTIRHVRRSLGSTRAWANGDVVITNDPWLTSGHLPDVTILGPVFCDGILIGWVGNIAHMVDIGGRVWSADSGSVFEEGLRIPPLLLFDSGVMNEVLRSIVLSNVRLPDQVFGDIMAQVNAVELGAKRLREMANDIGVGRLMELADEVCRRSERSMREAIEALPDGTYEAVEHTDGLNDEEITLRAAVNVSGSDMHVDYAGTTNEVASGGLNTVLNYTRAYTRYPIKCVLDPASPRNEGTYRPIKVTAPEGSILNPRFPAPVNARQLVGHRLSSVLFKALAQAVPQKVIADSGSAPTLRIVISGRWPDGRAFSAPLFVNGGMGARPTSDGLSCTCFPSNVVGGSMESLEATAPLLIECKELSVDSGGAGRYRGGLGQDVTVRLVSPYPATLSIFAERIKHPAAGADGGHDGAPALVEINGDEHGVPHKGTTTLPANGVVRVVYPGGGGFGPPAERSREAVSRDVANGYVSRAAADKEFGA